MINEKKRLFTLIFSIIDILMLFVAFFLAWYLRFKTPIIGSMEEGLSFQLYLISIILIIPLYLIISFYFGLYNIFNNDKRLTKEIWESIKINFILLLLFIGFLFMFNIADYSRKFLFLFGVLTVVFTAVGRVLFSEILKYNAVKNYNLKHVLIVGDGELAIRFSSKINKNKNLGYKISGFLGYKHAVGFEIGNSKVIGNISDLNSVLIKHDYDRVIISIPLKCYKNLTKIVDICEFHGVKAEIIPDYYKYIPAKPSLDMLDEFPIITIRHVPLDNIFNKIIKRFADIFISLIAIIITSPIMLITAIVIKLSSTTKPILFKQERIGFRKKPFIMYKFRSMKVQDDSKEVFKWTTENDSRKTKIGSFIRKTSIDELTQFFNVLKGEMSVVGPRPERPYFVDKFQKEIPKDMVKHQVKPGLTGWAQIHGCRGNTSIKKRVEYDIEYVENWKFTTDLLIIFKTFNKMNENAY